jgi:hypothetical protein
LKVKQEKAQCSILVFLTCPIPDSKTEIQNSLRHSLQLSDLHVLPE